MEQKTYLPKVNEIERKWHVVNAEGQVLGRLAVQIANILRGRNKAIYTPHLDTGDFVIVINAEKVVLTGRKNTRKIYQDYSGYMGGLKKIQYSKLMETKPEKEGTLRIQGGNLVLEIELMTGRFTWYRKNRVSSGKDDSSYTQ